MGKAMDNDRELMSTAPKSTPGKKPPSTPRLFIKEMVMQNFKSYAGAQRVGPFRKSVLMAVVRATSLTRCRSYSENELSRPYVREPMQLWQLGVMALFMRLLMDFFGVENQLLNMIQRFHVQHLLGADGLWHADGPNLTPLKVEKDSSNITDITKQSEESTNLIPKLEGDIPNGPVQSTGAH